LDNTTMIDRRKRPPQRGGQREGLAGIDRQLIEALARRAQAMANAARARKARGGSLADREQERSSWREWAAQASAAGLDLPTLRKLFALANGLGYELAGHEPAAPARRLFFRPDPGPLDLDLAGPRSRLFQRAALFSAGVRGAVLRLDPAVLDDALADLAKALNSAGGRVSMGADALTVDAGPAPDLANRSLFVGEDELNLYLLLALAVGRPGRSTFTGGTALKALDLAPAAELCTRLGARLAAVEPMSWGLPARLESTGLVDSGLHHGEIISRLDLGEDTPPLLALALALAAPFYPAGLTLAWPEVPALDAAMAQAASLLPLLGAKAESAGRTLRVLPGITGPDAAPAVSLDPLLAAYLLAAPRLAGGRVAVSGPWPAAGAESRAAADVLDLLKAAGLDVAVAADRVQVKAVAVPTHPMLSAAGRGELAPLACALALAAPEGATLRLPEDSMAEAEAFFAACGRQSRPAGEALELVPTGSAAAPRPEPALPCASAWWVLGLAVAAFALPGAAPANPGLLSGLWPAFPRLYADAFGPRREIPKEPDNDRKPRRRVKL
jgi:3-phosphoshikimate 1-carboxyvinyltransferase